MRAINNLIDNAALHAGHGGPVEVRVDNTGVTVRDHGDGIAEANLGRALKALRARPVLNTKVEIRKQWDTDPCGAETAAALAAKRKNSRRCNGTRQYGVLLISPEPVTYHRSLMNGLPARRSTIQSAIRIGGNGPRLAAGTLPTEWRES